MQSSRVGRDADFLRPSANNEGQADIRRLHQLRLQLIRYLVERLIGPTGARLLRWRKRHDQDRHIADASRNDQRLGNTCGNPVAIGAYLFVNAQHGVVWVGAHLEAGGHQHPVILGLAVDVLYSIHALDDGFQRLGHQFGGVRRAQSVGAYANIDQRHADLRLFLARNGQHREQAKRECGQQKQRRQGRPDRRPAQRSGEAELHCAASAGRMTSPERSLESTSTPSGMSDRGIANPRWTGASIAPPSRERRT